MDVDPQRRKETPSAENTPPGNHHPGNPRGPGILLRPDTVTGDPNPGLHIDTIDTNGSTDARADGNPGTHGVADRETHCRKGGDAGQFFDPRTNSDSGTPRGTCSPEVAGHLCVALRTIRRRTGVYRR